MAYKAFDITLKDMIEDRAAAWPGLLGPWPAQRVDVIDADISTLTASSDKVLRVHDVGAPWLLNLELQADHELGLPEKLHFKSVALHKRHKLLVRSVVFLLRRDANASDLTGLFQLQFPKEAEPYEVFRYHVVRLWQLPLERLLTGDVGILPLAPLTDAAAAQLPEVIARIDERMRREVLSAEREKLWAATFILMGLRYEPGLAQQFWQGVMKMTVESSSTYQWLITKGRLAEARAILLRLGGAKFGPPDAVTVAALEAMTDLGRLETLLDRILLVSSWQELLAE